jgi:formate--tetrahydrofolate ligase
VFWHRVVDMNDRALREMVISLGGVANGFPRQDGFDITVASEVMAIFCLARDLKDLERRLGNIVVAHTRDRKDVTARDLNAHGAMTVLLKDALMPNLVQTLENNPVFVHGGPFGNIAHGCNSVLATTTALKLADYVVTEAGFGADLGAEKFFNIKCRKAGLSPAAAVIVATVRALKMHGGIAKENLGTENVAAVVKGAANLSRHIKNVQSFGVPVVVAINRFDSDTEAEIEAIRTAARAEGVEAVLCEHWRDGGKGTAELARRLVEMTDKNGAKFRVLYPDDMPLWEKTEAIATKLYGASEIVADTNIRQRFRELQTGGFGKLPICMAKTQYSFSTDPLLKGAPSGHVVAIREVRLSAGAEFLVVITGDIMTMPGLPRTPSANTIRLNQAGEVEGLF